MSQKTLESFEIPPSKIICAFGLGIPHWLTVGQSAHPLKSGKLLKNQHYEYSKPFPNAGSRSARRSFTVAKIFPLADRFCLPISRCWVYELEYNLKTK
jgi:hypothetical protein